MKRYRYAIGAALGILLTVIAVIVISMKADQAPRVTSVWPLVLAVGVSVVAWWLQGMIGAVIARPKLGILRVREMIRIYLAGAFIGGISPIRGAEIPYEVYLLKRMNLSAGSGTTVIITRGMLNVMVLVLGAISALIFSSRLPEIGNWKLLFGALAIGLLWGLATLLVRRLRSQKAPQTVGAEGTEERPSGWRGTVPKVVLHFLADVKRSFFLLWRKEHRRVLLYGVILTMLYWAMRLSFGPLALMAAGWSGDWPPVILAQLLISAFVLPFAPTPGGSGATELGFAAFLTAYATHSELVSGVVIYAGLTHYLPTVVGAFCTGRQLWQGISPGE